MRTEDRKDVAASLREPGAGTPGARPWLANGTRIGLVGVGLLVVMAASLPLRSVGETMDSDASTYFGAAATYLVVGLLVIVLAIRARRPWVTAATVAGVGGLLLTGGDLSVTSALPGIIGAVLATVFLALEFLDRRAGNPARPRRAEPR